MWVRLAIAAAALAATLAGGIGIGAKWVRGEWAQADLAREREEKEMRDEMQRLSAAAGAKTEAKLAEAARRLADVRADADGVRELAGAVSRAAGKACERDAERVRVLSGLVSEGARLLEEAEGVAGRLDARLSGCQAAP